MARVNCEFAMHPQNHSSFLCPGWLVVHCDSLSVPSSGFGHFHESGACLKLPSEARPRRHAGWMASTGGSESLHSGCLSVTPRNVPKVITGVCGGGVGSDICSELVWSIHLLPASPCLIQFWRHLQGRDLKQNTLKGWLWRSGAFSRKPGHKKMPGST